MPNTLQFKRGALSGLPSLAAGEPGFTTDQFRLYVGSAGGNRLVGLLHNNAATAAPTVNDDAGDGYSVGSRWIDVTADKAYECVDATVGSAVWQQQSGSGSGGITQLTGDATAGPGSGSQALTLANSGVTAGTYGGASAVPVLTFDSKGRCTGASTASIATGLDITGLTAADPADADELPVYDASATANRKVTVQKLTALGGLTPGGRLTDGTSDPWFGGSGGSTIYYLPVYHSRLPLWDGTRWLNVGYSDSGLSLALSGLTAARPYDVFVYSSSGTATLELLAWSSGTARATGISIQDGRYCKTGDKTRLYLGTIYTATTSSISRTITSEPIWNMYHRGRREMWAYKTSGTHTYASGTWRSANADNAYRCEFVRGLNAEAVSADVRCNTSGASCAGRVGVGLDRTNDNDAQVVTEAGHDSAGMIVYTATARYVGRPAVGYHYVQWVEAVRAGTVTYRADLTGRAGMTVEVWA